MGKQRVKVRIRIPVIVDVFRTECGERLSYQSLPECPDYLEVEGVVEVDSSLQDSVRDVAACDVALESLANILSGEMDQPGMLSFKRAGR